MASCIDSDGGKNIFVKGTTKSINKIATDECNTLNNNFITEYYCQENEAISTYAQCPNSCKDGACTIISDSSVVIKREYEERNRQKNSEQTCNTPVSSALMYAVSLNPEGVCMGGELGDLIVPPSFVDNSNHPIPNLQPKGYLDQNRQILSCSIPCSIPIKRISI